MRIREYHLTGLNPDKKTSFFVWLECLCAKIPYSANTGISYGMNMVLRDYSNMGMPKYRITILRCLNNT